MTQESKVSSSCLAPLVTGPGPASLHDAVDFLVQLCEFIPSDAGYLELRVLAPKDSGRGLIFRGWLPLSPAFSRDRFAAWIPIVAMAMQINRAQPSALFYGLNPRTQKRGHAEDVPLVYATGLDLDTSDAVSRAQKLTAHAPPFGIVATGTPGHGQIVWRFRDPMRRHDGEALGLQLRKAVGGDVGTESAAKMMKLPHGKAWKSGAPVLVTALLDPIALTAPEVLKRLMPAPMPEITESVVRIELPDPPADIAELLMRIDARTRWSIENGHVEGDGFVSRSELDASVLRALREAGANDTQVLQVFDRYAIGEKHLGERGYFKKTLDFVDESLATSRPVRVRVRRVGILPGGRRVMLDLAVVDTREDFSTGISPRSLAWSAFFAALGLPRAEDGDVVAALTAKGRETEVELRLSARGKREVSRWIVAPAGRRE